MFLISSTGLSVTLLAYCFCERVLSCCAQSRAPILRASVRLNIHLAAPATSRVRAAPYSYLGFFSAAQYICCCNRVDPGNFFTWAGRFTFPSSFSDL